MLARAAREGRATHAIEFAARVVRAAVDEPMPRGTVLNVNMPGSAATRYQWTTLGRRVYEDDVAERHDPRGRPYYWVGGGPTGHDDVPGTDCVAVARGWNSITPMHLDLTDRGARREAAVGARRLSRHGRAGVGSPRVTRWLVLALVACSAACAAPSATTTVTSTATPPPTTRRDVRQRQAARRGAVSRRGEQREPKRVDEYVADNTAMVMNDCAKNPAKLAPCLAAAATVAELEQECLIPLDDEGTEGEGARVKAPRSRSCSRSCSAACSSSSQPPPNNERSPTPSPVAHDTRTPFEQRRDAACKQLAPKLTQCAVEDAKADLDAGKSSAQQYKQDTDPRVLAKNTEEFIDKCTSWRDMSSRQVRVLEVCYRDAPDCTQLRECLKNLDAKN